MTSPTYNRRTMLGGTGLALVGMATLRWPAPARTAPARYPVTRSTAEWRRLLGPQRFAILRQGSTERPYTSPLNKEKRAGVYSCAGCAQPLFASATKYESGTGWPSFWKALPRGAATKSDRTLGFERTEVLCARCGGHLGHLFDDGPRPTGQRYCMNGLALRFRTA